MGNIWFIVMGCLSVLSFVELGIIIYLQKNRYCKVVKTTNISTEEVEVLDQTPEEFYTEKTSRGDGWQGSTGLK